MKKPFFMLTGDDSVRAEGLILVKRIIEQLGYDYQIVATKTQQSGASGKITINGGSWGKEMVDGHEAVWVDGTPVDSVMFGMEYLKREPNYVISGMNYGENLSKSMYISGTVSAVFTATVKYNVPSMAFSIEQASQSSLMEHDGNFDDVLLEYPGGLIKAIIQKALEYGIPKGNYWNVNMPAKPTTEIKFVETEEDGYYDDNVIIEKDRFRYPFGKVLDGWKDGTDTGELIKGYAVINPCKLQYTNYEELKRLRSK